MKNTHTPGPWDIESLGGHFTIGASGRGNLAVTRAPIDYRDGEIAANARLIAAAPDLLAALMKIRLNLVAGECAGGGDLEVVFDLAQAAIAKATGETL